MRLPTRLVAQPVDIAGYTEHDTQTPLSPTPSYSNPTKLHPLSYTHDTFLPEAELARFQASSLGDHLKTSPGVAGSAEFGRSVLLELPRPPGPILIQKAARPVLVQ